MANTKEYTRNKEGSNISKIIVDRDLCITASSCIATSGEIWELDSENKAVVKDANAADDEILINSAKSCPTKAIFLFDKKGKQIWPE
ncbi:MAG: ferredoxin [Candidatus Zambryskibacteria bacterium]|nr:ferredoxin [Candidatus Zambryskibacteria bacterium]